MESKAMAFRKAVGQAVVDTCCVKVLPLLMDEVVVDAPDAKSWKFSSERKETETEWIWNIRLRVPKAIPASAPETGRE